MHHIRSAHDRSPVLITGGAGFIGSHVAERLHADGYPVMVIDDLSAGSPANLPDHLPLYQLSILDPAVREIVVRSGVGCIIHCAAQPSVAYSMQHPVDDLHVNLLGTFRLLEAGRAAKVGQFIFLSSGGAVYGETPVPATEETPARPWSYYAVHKLAAEYHTALSGLSYAIVRPANVYGPRQRAGQEGGVIPIVSDCVRDGQPITIFGDGEQERDFIHVDDVVSAIAALVDHPEHGIWNVGTGTRTTVKQLASTIESLHGRTVPRRFQPARSGDVFRSCLDSGKLRRELDWQPKVNLVDGLARLLCPAH